MNVDGPTRLPRYWRIIAIFVAMTMLQASVAAFSIHLLSAARAYVTGESLYSKGQKDAQIILLEYAEKQREADYARFMAALPYPWVTDQREKRCSRRSLMSPRRGRAFWMVEIIRMTLTEWFACSVGFSICHSCRSPSRLGPRAIA